ncbi:uncharacterized protein LOC111633293 [Centruroides sculpturatus]|uniref:uncharacterized protein LOC111633293 n=1 Tax=Centruroides sculpturatus TaxID=218467 RepID=UPI000C6E2B0E|nr:uncharacterized protein LOC111633293 [Centruroides sculpturatus]
MYSISVNLTLWQVLNVCIHVQLFLRYNRRMKSRLFDCLILLFYITFAIVATDLVYFGFEQEECNETLANIFSILIVSGVCWSFLDAFTFYDKEERRCSRAPRYIRPLHKESLFLVSEIVA